MMGDCATWVSSGGSSDRSWPPSFSSTTHDESKGVPPRASTTFTPTPLVISAAWAAGLVTSSLRSGSTFSSPEASSTFLYSTAMRSAVVSQSVFILSAVYVRKCCSHTKETTPMATSAVIAAIRAKARVTRVV